MLFNSNDLTRPNILFLLFFPVNQFHLTFPLSFNHYTMETRSDEAPLQRGSLPKRTPQQDFYFETNAGYVDHVGFASVWSFSGIH